ncbi:hypothetical protein UCRPC4_g02117 [Phaeomoniella chlamydospora]|uniref:Uncharacterized protein n=1 Tax=Phaeomoniella chlamydospora TaxID=158046 RepID=A0A0G2H8W1_PHACM|nr:hypothetical protein UCRPC4_g02117 [Phaeomoniella chlamydospora]
MSGSNPFRRSQKIAEIPNVAAPSTNVYDDDEATAAGRRFPPLNIEVVPSTSRQKTKTVRIASPPAGTPISPESFPSEPPSPVYTRRVGQSGSPPLPDSDSSSSDESVPKDPFAAADSEPNEIAAEEEVLRNTRRNSALSAEDSSEEHKSDTDTVRRTLAKFSPRPQRAQPREEVNTHGGGAQRASRPKQQLDVDAFKRLLLTGNSATAISADGVSISSAGLSLSQLSESGSNTDTASTSRQSIFETLAPPATDIPRSSQTEETGAESQRLGSHDERKKPPPPKTRHGKLIKNDPSLTSPKKVVDNEIDPIVREQTLEDSGTTALDKPLPSPPNEQHTTLSQNVHVEPLLSSPKIPRRPPTPPVTRRQINGVLPATVADIAPGNSFI